MVTTTRDLAPPGSGRFRCTECGHEASRWFGRCPRCAGWSTAEEAHGGASHTAAVTTLAHPSGEEPRWPTGIAEVDRVLGGGMVAGAAVLLAGEPGIGKSTLVLQLVDALLARRRRCLLVTGEESVTQVALRARRLGVSVDDFRVTTARAIGDIVGVAAAERPDTLVVDSVQSLEGAVDQPAGTVAQVRECAAALVRMAKGTGIAVLLVGHVTKDGAVAGPKALEHLVDVVLTLEGERSGAVRLLRASKNRYGSCEETGVFVMAERGLEAVADPSSMLLADRRPGVTGSVVFPALEGTRGVLTEVQALTSSTDGNHPQRVAIGLDQRRLALLLGVLEERAKIKLGSKDVFATAAGGLAVTEPGADLALALALASAWLGRPLARGMVAVGEVGLAGEVRRVPGLRRRLVEAARLGFTVAVCPPGADDAPPGLQVRVVADVGSAIVAACLAEETREP
ncbi:DNA repair protein RadA [soil metagenome]